MKKLVPWKWKKILNSNKEAKETIKRLSILENKIKCQQKHFGWIFLSFCLAELLFFRSILLSFDELVCVRKRKFIFREISLFRAIHVNYGLAQHSVRTGNKKSATGASSENYFLFRQNYRACKMRCNYAGMKLPSAICEENKNKISSQVTSPMQLQNRKFKVVNWEGTAAKCTT